MAAQTGWKPYDSLTQAPTNLKEAIDWVLRVTGKDGKKNEKPQQPSPSPPRFSCICFLAKAVKDLLYDARSPESPGPSQQRYWNDLLLEQESDIVLPVLEDLGLVNSDSTIYSAAGGTEVIRTLIDQLAQGLQKWVGWKEGDKCCLKGTEGIGKKCDCPSGVGAGCCTGGTKCHECGTCGTSGSTKCYLSAYCKKNSTSGGGGASTEGQYYWPSISSDCTKVHLLARIFLGSVCLIWSGLSHLGFLTGDSRWKDHELAKIDSAGNKAGLGSFMAAMGYDLDRLNGSGGQGKGNGELVWKLLTGTEPNGKDGIQWNEFKNGADNSSVAEYYSSIYGNVKSKKTEEICKDYPLLVLHILASGYFRAGSAGANKVPVAPKAATSTATKDTAPRNPRTIREILYWLSALPYSKGYCQLVTRMQQKTDQVTQGNDEKNKNKIVLHDENSGKNTELNKDCITHYLMAACGYCPLVLIGIQGTINTSGTDSDPAKPGVPGAVSPAAAAKAAVEKKPCPKHKDNRHKRCDPKDIKEQENNQSQSTNGELQAGEVCYGGYHLAVKDFGPLHGMYANGLFGFDMDGSPAQCLDQLRVYVYHCFYQLYFLRKQCSVGAIAAGGGGAGKTVLGWNSCRYGSGVAKKSGGVNVKWQCTVENTGSGGTDHTKKCGLQSGASTVSESALQGFLCDSIYGMYCRETLGKTPDSEDKPYPEIDAHMNKSVDFNGKEQDPHKKYPELCPVPMGWDKDNHFKDLNTGSHKQAPLDPASGSSSTTQKYPAHCTGNTLSLLLEYYCDPEKCHGTLVVLLRLLACITPTVPRTLGDLFGFYYYIVYIGGKSGGGSQGEGVNKALGIYEKESKLHMPSIGGTGTDVVQALTKWNGGSSGCTSDCKKDTLRCLYGGGNNCTPFLCPLSGQQYGQLSPLMAGTYLSWLVYLIEKFEDGLGDLQKAFRDIVCRDNCSSGQGGAGGCGGDGKCQAGTHGDPCSSGSANQGVCGCTSVVSCTGVLPVLYKYGFGYGDVKALHKQGGTDSKKCHEFLTTLGNVEKSTEFKKLTNSINQLIYTTRLPWIFVLTLAWLVAVLYLAFGAIWPLDWTHMRSHCRGWFRKGSLSPWEVLMVGKKKGRGILEYFGKT